MTSAPSLEFELDYVGTFGADEINEFRAAHPKYADIPMLDLGTIDDGTHLILRGYVRQTGGRIVDLALYATGEDSPMWSLGGFPDEGFSCEGGTITTIRGDEHGCRYGVGWEWAERDRTWRIEGRDGQPGDEFVAHLVLL